MKFHPCPDTKPHGRHEGYWKNILRRDCAGVIDWENVPLAGVCAHGVGMLDACEDCEAWSAAPRDAIDDEEFAEFNKVVRSAREGS